MENDCQTPCAALRQLNRELTRYRQQTDERLREGSTRFAVIDTKLNWLIGILGSIGISVLGVLLKLAAG